jgi:HAD superfamily hydrolase (TIGR01509 family)
MRNDTTPVRAVIFDFDGLLADSEPLQIHAWQQFLSRYDKRLEPDLLHEMFGLRVRDSSKLVRERLDLPISPEQVMDERDEIFMELVERELSLFPGARPLVSRLSEMHSIRLALATSGRRPYIELALRTSGLAGAFEVEVNGDDVQRGKPDPEIYLRAAQRLGVAPGACVALEDAPHGIHSAKSAGMRCLAVPNDMTRQIPGFERADAVLEGLSEVIPWLQRNRLLACARD